MANDLRVKRRAQGGAAGAPPSLLNAELAFNEQDLTLYYGLGSGGAGGTATNVIAIAGPGGFTTINTNQTITSIKTFDQSPLVPTATAGDNTTKAASTAFVQAAITSASVPDGNKGDITVSGATWTVNESAITNAKLANVTANSIKGRSGTAGEVTDMSVAAVRSMLTINNVNNTSDAAKPISTATQAALDLKVNTSALGANNGVATLDAAGKLNPNQIPAIAISDTFVVANQAAMLALTAEVGDIAIRSDLNQTFILRASPASTLANWQQLLTPTSAVASVFGRTGAVAAASGDYTVAQVTGAAPLASPALTGTPTAPTAATAANSTQIATTAFVKAQGYTTNAGTVTSVGLAGGTTGLSFSAAITTSGNITVSGTLAVAHGGTGATTAAAARTNLQLGTMATQNANAVNITGGTIDNITIDGGTF